MSGDGGYYVPSEIAQAIYDIAAFQQTHPGQRVFATSRPRVVNTLYRVFGRLFGNVHWVTMGTGQTFTPEYLTFRDARRDAEIEYPKSEPSPPKHPPETGDNIWRW